MKGLAKKLRHLNAIIWARDGGQCIRCGSGQIAGERGKTGSHHVLSRGAHYDLILQPENACLLCVICHENANTQAMARELFGILNKRYHYEAYKQLPYSYYLEEP